MGEYMKNISIEVYTYSDIQSTAYGIYKSVTDNSFTVLAIVYSVDDGESIVVDVEAGDVLSQEIICALLRKDITKYSYNSERTITSLSKYLNMKLSIEGWISICDTLKYIGLSTTHNVYKYLIGNGPVFNENITFFCTPEKNNNTRNLSSDNPVKWKEFLKEVKKDFWEKHSLRKGLEIFKVSEEYRNYEDIKKKMRNKGLKINEIMLRNSVQKEYWEALEKIKYVCHRFNLLNKDSVLRLENKAYAECVAGRVSCDISELREYIELLDYKRIYQYKNVYQRICNDGYLHGITSNYWDINEFFEKYVVYDKSVNIVSFPYIEICVMAWLADEKWLIEALTHKETMEQEIKEKLGIREDFDVIQIYNSCMSGGGVWTLKKSNMIGTDDKEYINQMIINWRMANSKIVDFWGQLYRAFCYAIMYHTDVHMGKISVCFMNNNVVVILPSGRKIIYMSPSLETNHCGDTVFSYRIFDRNNEYKVVKARAGIICRGIVAKIIDDIIAFYTVLLDKKGCDLLEVVHKKIMVKCDENVERDDIKKIIDGRVPTWATDMPLIVENFVCSKGGYL